MGTLALNYSWAPSVSPQPSRWEVVVTLPVACGQKSGRAGVVATALLLVAVPLEAAAEIPPSMLGIR